MQVPNDRQRPSTPPRKKRRRRNTAAIILLVVLLLLGAASFFVFGVNKWSIRFHLHGEPEVTREC